MKKLIIITATIVLIVIVYCFVVGSSSKEKNYANNKSKSSSYSSSYSSYDSYESSKKTSFTNKYGTSTTKCAHSGCNNYIASSGDTNCCTIHSKKCYNCNCYIDEDAWCCLDCIKKALK